MSKIISVRQEDSCQRFISKKELARRLGVSERTIYNRDIRLGMISRAYRDMRSGCYESLSPKQVAALTILHNLYSQGLNIKSIKRELSKNPHLFSQELPQ